MPNSDPANIEWVKWVLPLLKPTTVIDVGPGDGKYGKLVKAYDKNIHVTGVEVWAPYAVEYELSKIYDVVHICDARIYPSFEADLVILGDVLEHMTRHDATNLWTRISEEADAALISIPVVHMPQGHVHGNPFEEHVVDHWTHDDVLSFFPGITGYQQFGATASYVAEF